MSFLAIALLVALIFVPFVVAIFTRSDLLTIVSIIVILGLCIGYLGTVKIPYRYEIMRFLASLTAWESYTLGILGTLALLAIGIVVGYVFLLLTSLRDSNKK